MRIIHLTYVQLHQHYDPHLWLKRLSFYTGVLEAMTAYAQVSSIHCISYDGIVNHKHVKYHFIKAKIWEKWLPIRLHKYVKALTPNVIIVHGLIFPWQVILLRWQLGPKIKIIAQHHAERPFDDVRKHLQRWADKYIGAYLFCSIEQGMQWVSKKIINDSKKVKEIMGTSSPFYVLKRDEAISITKAQPGINYLWVGRLDNNKDPLLVARAFLRFHKINKSANLYMIYQTFELLSELQAIIDQEYDADSFIHLIGKVKNEDLLYWYNSAEFIISSSHYEGSGIAVCEGISCGCIPILTDIPSFRAMTDKGRIGLLYEAGSENGLLASLRESMVLDRQAMKQQVLHHFNSKLSFNANAKSILETIHTI